MDITSAVWIVDAALPAEKSEHLLKAWRSVCTNAFACERYRYALKWHRPALYAITVAENSEAIHRLVWANGEVATREDVAACVGTGWRKLVLNLLDILEPLSATPTADGHLPPTARWDGTIYEVKEKFGELRFCVGSVDALVHDIIDYTTELSLLTCEECGEPGKCREDLLWVKTLCGHHYERKEKKWMS
jgi:hypothetical protein